MHPHTGSTSWADFNLAWGPLLEDRTIRSSQGDRRSTFRLKTVLPGGVGPYDFCHNFHIVCDSEDVKRGVLAAEAEDFVTLTGALVRVFGNPARFPNPASWTSSVAGEYCYVMLVEEFTNHGQKVPDSASLRN